MAKRSSLIDLVKEQSLVPAPGEYKVPTTFANLPYYDKSRLLTDKFR